LRMSDGSSDGCSSDLVHALGGHCELTGPQACPQARGREIAAQGACLLDQFGLAERATDWRGNNNIAESIVGQLQHERYPEPAWIVCGAGTGGTSATIGRYLRRSEEHTSELQSLMRISYAVFCLKKKKT